MKMLARHVGAVLTLFLGLGALTAEAGVVDEIKQRGKLVVGVEGKGFGAFIYTDKEGKIVGHDPSLSQLIADRIGVKLELVDTAWAGIIPALYAKRFDMILGGMTITKARLERVSFSVPYADGSHILLTRANSTVAQVADLSGKVLASQLGSASLNFLKGLETELKQQGKPGFKDTKEYENFPEAALELDNNRIEGLLIPKPVALELMGKQPNRYRIAIEFPQRRYFGAAIRKEDSDLLAAVNEAIMAAKKDGTLEKLQVKWFGWSMGQIPNEFTPDE